MQDAGDDHFRRIVRDAVRSGVRDALDEIMHDESQWDRLTERLYIGLSTHATNGVSQWIGKRILLGLLAAAVSASITWAVLTGRLK